VKLKEILILYNNAPGSNKLLKAIEQGGKYRLNGNAGSAVAVMLSYLMPKNNRIHIAMLNDREEAAYFYNDMTALLDENSVSFLPSSYKRLIRTEEKDNDSVSARTEVLDRIANRRTRVIVTYPEAFAERVIEKHTLHEMSMTLTKGEKISITFLENLLSEYGFNRSEFVYEPGQFSIRGSIVDIYSYAEDMPIRIDFFGDEVETIRYFDIETQLSERTTDKVSIVPDLSRSSEDYTYTDLLSYFDEQPVWWLKNGLFANDKIRNLRTENEECHEILGSETDLFDFIERGTVIEWGPDLFFRGTSIDLQCEAQPNINKNYDIFAETLKTRINDGYQIYVCSTNEKQILRLRDIFKDKGQNIDFKYLKGTIHEGFSDATIRICLYTEHQIFDRYHKYSLKTSQLRKGRESISIDELQSLHPGDYVVHIDHGIGRFGGLTKINNNGNEQEVIRLVYKNNSELYVSLYSLHKISKYRGKDGTAPVVNKLGGDAWNKLKQRAKSKVKDIARELISLYARRKNEPAYAFGKDSYLQEEMEASFMYEETPDQMKAIEAVKYDMETPNVMDRLVCGDVGFGKTEVAIRAAFKAVGDSKQVAVLVPTTILAYQHYNTFSERLKGMPCTVEYISRMRKASDVKRILSDLKDGKIDIIIGTHKLTGKEVVFKDLGLLIVDEEQKFGVSVKEKLKHLKVNVDTITMTATPIPRTLQFSLMGARDMSIIRTPPPNRYPIITELHRFDEKLIKEAINYEVARGGQVFFIHNRVENIRQIQEMLSRILPKIKSCIVHGQMDGEQMEKTMHDFIRGDYDVLIATTIIESGLDIPNANTIIINQAQNYGLSDLHQLRGRVGRSNKKAFCYLLTPSLDLVNPDARRRLKAIEDFSGLGSGFNIAMQDLDIRGAGNILGAEQSGFISEIGYETYQRILNEALYELRTEEYPDMPMAQTDRHDDFPVKECVIETDFEVMIPETYVESITERIKLYRELDNISNDSELISFEERLNDRFGQVPAQVKALMEIVRIRKKCMKMGIERLVAKKSKVILYFVNDDNSPYYSGKTFAAILKFIQQQIVSSQMSERNNKLTLTFSNVNNIDKLYLCIEKMYEYTIN
jgi:transcription-repair coupling factor (superfamily II helicase)